MTLRRRAPAVDCIVAPFTVLVDTREQAPWSFQGLTAPASRGGTLPLVVPTQAYGLPTGDYSLAGFESLVSIERKSLEDLYGTLGRGRERFVRELERLDQMRFAAVVVEGGWSQIIGTPPPDSRMAPKSVYRSILAFMQRYRGVHWFTAPDRRFAEVSAYRMLERFWIDNVKASG